MLKNTARIALVALIAACSWSARAACNDAAGCPDAGALSVSAADPAAPPQPVQIAGFPGDTLGGLTRRGSGAGSAGAALGDLRGETHPAGALIVRSGEDVAGARAMIRPQRQASEPVPAAASEPSAWIMLLAGLAFAGVIVRKRSGG